MHQGFWTIIGAVTALACACAQDDAATTGASADTAGDSASAAGTTGASEPGAGESGGRGEADCDVTGIWAVRLMSVVEGLGLEQCGNLYYYMQLRQQGEDVEVVDQFNCGIEGRGTASSTFNDATKQALLLANSQIGRRGTMRKAADGTCDFHMEPYWTVIGVDEEAYAPSPRNADMNLSTLQAMTPLPTENDEDVIDVDSDGHPGIAFIVTGALSGKRHALQRNFQAWLTNERYRITPAPEWPDDVEVRADYIGEDMTLEVEPPDNVLLGASANPVRNAEAARVTLRFLGRDASDPRAAAILVSTDPSADPAGAVATCNNIVSALPPIVPLTSPQVCPCPGGGACT